MRTPAYEQRLEHLNRLKYIEEKWSVTIDGYSIPFPDHKEAKYYLDYIRRWQTAGEIIGYDHAKQTLFWTKQAVRPINANPAKGHVPRAPHNKKRRYSRAHAVPTDSHSSL